MADDGSRSPLARVVARALLVLTIASQHAEAALLDATLPVVQDTMRALGADPMVAVGFGAGAVVGSALRGGDLLSLVDPDRKPLPLSKIYVRPGRGKFGVGLVCVRDVPQGARICKCYPDFSKTVSMASLDKLEPGVRETIHEIWDCVNYPPGKCLVPTDYEAAFPIIGFINHSRQPNCEYDYKRNAIIASRPLRKGEEATVDYFMYQEEGSYTWEHAATGFSPDYIKTVYSQKL